jgi:hypothetical protein
VRDLSTKGVTRRHASFITQIAISLNGGTISLRDHIVGGNGSVRDRLESMARREHSFGVSECIYGWTAAFRQTWTHIVVRIQLSPDAGISNATMTTLRNTWETTIENRWSDVWGAGRSGELTCPFTFDVQWVTSNAHHNVRVRPGPARSNMTTWDTNDTGAVASHEFGHMIGNPDEYPDSNCPGRSPVSTGTIMDDNSNTIPARLLQELADNLNSNVVGL